MSDINATAPITPGNHPRISRVMPKPFRRPSMSVRGPNHVPKVWRWAHPEDLSVGDIVKDYGVVVQTEEMIEITREAISGMLPWGFRITVGRPESQVLEVRGDDEVFAFTAVKDTHA